MVPLLLLLPAGAAAGAFLFYRQSRAAALKQTEAFRSVAEAVGLKGVEVEWTSVFGPTTWLSGRFGALRVWIWTRLRGAEAEPDRAHFLTRLSNVILVDGLGLAQDELEFHPEGFRSRLGKALGSREIELGDHGFDENIFLRGSRPLILALFDYETRRRVVALVQAIDTEVSLTGGALRVEVPDTLDAPALLAERVETVLDVGRRLARPADVPGRLAANAREDPLSRVRLANLRTLVALYAGRPAALGALRSALADPDPDVRLWSGREMGEEGRPVLVEMASNAETPEAAQAGAIWALGGDLPRDVAFEILSDTLRSRRLPVAEACLGSLGPRGGADVVSVLSKVLAVERGWLAAVAAKALGGSGEASAEGPLLTALDRADEDVAIAAAEALGRVGTASAVAHLHEAESGSGSANLRRAAREAVARIQERLTGADPGQLSLAGGESGQLSLSDDEAGRVALLEDDDPTPGEDGSGSTI